jgi:hypothetical protein
MVEIPRQAVDVLVWTSMIGMRQLPNKPKLVDSVSRCPIVAAVFPPALWSQASSEGVAWVKCQLSNTICITTVARQTVLRKRSIKAQSGLE